jgi:Cu/Ag efflux protein CusF
MYKAKLTLLAMLMAPMLAFSHGDDMHLDDAQEQVVQADKSAVASMSEGEIKRINKETGKVTIKHGPLQNLDMPGMTMLFRMQDPAMLDQIKEGDTIKFVEDKVDGTFVVKSLQVEK